MLVGDPRTQQAAYGGAAVIVAPIGPADIAAHQVGAAAQTSGADPDLPADPPALVQPGPSQAVCAVVQPHGTTPTTAVSLIASASLAGQAPTAQPGVVPACEPADTIAVSADRGALVHALSTGGTVATTTYLVTDNGVKYPLPDSASVTQIGYASANAVGLPAGLLGLLPTGPSLDRSALTDGVIVATPVVSGHCSQ